jgi:hypothetical protein
VELNREIMPRAKWSTTALTDGDRLEIVHFVGGGAPGPDSRPENANQNANPQKPKAAPGDERPFLLRRCC